jgi:hypothetical protein
LFLRCCFDTERAEEVVVLAIAVSILVFGVGVGDIPIFRILQQLTFLSLRITCINAEDDG